MKKCIKNIVLLFTLILSLYVFSAGITVLAEPTIIDLNHDPQNPEILSTVTFSATITGEDITSVHLFIQECEKDGVCFQPSHNITMSLSAEADTYYGEVTLDKENAEVMKYNLVILDNGTWYNYLHTDLREVDLVIPSNGNQNGGNGDSTPGFELISIFLSISLFILISKRKRLR